MEIKTILLKLWDLEVNLKLDNLHVLYKYTFK